MIYYIYLALAVILELVGTNFLKASEGFTKLNYTLGTLLSFSLCFYFLSMSLKGINLNIAYATWGGLGIVLTAVISVLVWKEQINLLSIIGILLVVSGVVILNLFGSGH